MKRFLSLLPLLFFILIILFVAYFMIKGLTTPPVLSQAPSPTPTPLPLPPTSTPTLTPSPPPPPSPTPTDTPPVDQPATPTPLPPPTDEPPTPTPSPTAKPATIAWVQIGNDLVHTLGLTSPVGANSELKSYVAAPALSPDGQKIIFFSESNLSGHDTGIWVADLVEGQAQNYLLLTDATHVQNIAWSPDGDKLAFEMILNPASPPEEWQSQIRVIRSDPEGGYIEFSVFDGKQPTWSPDSQKLAIYTCKGSDCGLFLLTCPGGECDSKNGQQVTSDSTDGYPAWSIDNTLAFTSKRSGDHEIYLLNLADNQLQNLTNRPGTDTTPIFSPDGQKIYFRTDATGVDWQIQAITLDGNRHTTQEINTVISNVGDDNNWGLVRPSVQ